MVVRKGRRRPVTILWLHITMRKRARGLAVVAAAGVIGRSQWCWQHSRGGSWNTREWSRGAEEGKENEHLVLLCSSWVLLGAGALSLTVICYWQREGDDGVGGQILGEGQAPPHQLSRRGQ